MTDKELVDELFRIDENYDASLDDEDYIAKMFAQQEKEEAKGSTS